MNNPSDICTATDQPFQQSAQANFNPAEGDDSLCAVLKRCPPATYVAARQFRATGEAQLVPTIVLGIIERFVESGLRPKLRQPHDSLLLAEDLGLDSLTMMEIVILVEDVLGLSIKNEELRQLRTLGDVRQFIAGKLRDQPRPEQKAG